MIVLVGLLINILTYRSLEFYFEDLPFLDQELAFRVAGEGETRLWAADVAAVVVTDWEFCV